MDDRWDLQSSKKVCKCKIKDVAKCKETSRIIKKKVEKAKQKQIIESCEEIEELDKDYDSQLTKEIKEMCSSETAMLIT